MISVPEEKIMALKAQLVHAVSKDTLKAREIASIIGRIISMSLAVGPISRLMTRRLYALLNSRSYWCQTLQVTLEAKEEVKFWLAQIEFINGR